MAMMHLKSTVAVGFVMGVTEKISPIGSATSTMPRSGNSRMTPTAGFVLDVVIDEFSGHHVLEDFILQQPEPGLFDCQTSEVLSLVLARQEPSL